MAYRFVPCPMTLGDLEGQLQRFAQSTHCCRTYQMQYDEQLCLHGFNWHVASRGPSAIVEGPRDRQTLTTGTPLIQIDTFSGVETGGSMNRGPERGHKIRQENNKPSYFWTRSSAIAEGPRDASCQLKSCQLPLNSAETIGPTTSIDQIDGMKLEI